MSNIRSNNSAGFVDYLDDRQLVEKILSGDKDSYRIFIDRYKNLVAHSVFRMVFNKEDREDLCQEVFIKAYINLRDFKFHSKISTWLVRIAYNSCINLLNKKSSQRLADIQDIDDNASEIFISNQPSPVDTLETKNLSEILSAELRKIPPRYRAILTLFHIEGLSYREIAEIVGLLENTIKSHLFRGRKHLKDLLLQNYNASDLWK